MKLIIDAYNLMYRLAIKADTLEKKRDKLIGLLNEFLEVNGGTITLVFDAGKNPSQHRGRETRGKIKVVFSANEETADDVIIELIKGRKGKAREYAVVSSDNKLIDCARENFMNAMTSDQFAEYLT